MIGNIDESIKILKNLSRRIKEVMRSSMVEMEVADAIDHVLAQIEKCKSNPLIPEEFRALKQAETEERILPREPFIITQEYSSKDKTWIRKYMVEVTEDEAIAFAESGDNGR